MRELEEDAAVDGMVGADDGAETKPAEAGAGSGPSQDVMVGRRLCRCWSRCFHPRSETFQESKLGI